MKYAKEVVGTHPLADIIVEDADKKFLERFENWVRANMERPDMQAMDFANSMKIGRTTFFKKVKQVPICTRVGDFDLNAKIFN